MHSQICGEINFILHEYTLLYYIKKKGNQTSHWKLSSSEQVENLSNSSVFWYNFLETSGFKVIFIFRQRVWSLCGMLALNLLNISRRLKVQDAF